MKAEQITDFPPHEILLYNQHFLIGGDLKDTPVKPNQEI